jgi:actin-related protein
MLLEHTLREELRMEPSECRVVLATHKPTDRPLLAELLFEKLHVPAAVVPSAAALCALGAGVLTGVVLDCGAGEARATAVLAGVAGETLNGGIGGEFITRRLLKLLIEGGYSFTSQVRCRVTSVVCLTTLFLGHRVLGLCVTSRRSFALFLTPSSRCSILVASRFDLVL